MGSNKGKQAFVKKAKQAKNNVEDVDTGALKGKKGASEPAIDPRSSSKKRPASTPAEPVAPVYKPETSDLEKKRLGVSDELRKVEQQIFDLETKYFELSSAYGNAVRGERFSLVSCR